MNILKVNNQEFEADVDKSWDSGLEPVTECPYMHPDKAVLVSKELIDMAVMLSRDLPGHEWLMYCEADEDVTTIKIHDCVIPKQTVSYGDVEVEKGMNLPVVIHSHHNMRLSEFSSIDDKYVNANHKISLLWTNDGGIASAVIKKELPCGHVALIEIENIMVYVPNDYDVSKVKEKYDSMKSNIEKETYTYVRGRTTKTVNPGVYGEYIDETDRQYRELLGDYYDSGPWWENYEDDVTGEETSELWKNK